MPVEQVDSPKRGVPAIEHYPPTEPGGRGKVRILDVVLDVLPLPEEVSARRFITPWDTMKSNVCWDTPTVLLMRDMAIRMNGGIPSRSEGPTGVSKSFAVEVLASLTQRSFIRHNYSKDSDPGDTIGRFVPADGRSALTFAEMREMLHGLPKSAREEKERGERLIEQATRDNRSLSVGENMIMAQVLGFADLQDKRSWRWQNGTLTGAMMYGSIFSADEPNLGPGNVLERENSALEKRATLRLVEHEGEVIRPLTPEEESIIADGGIVPGVIGLHNDYWYVGTQNPYGIGGGRTEESEARRNRLQDLIVDPLTKNDYQEYLSFLIHGDQPDIVWQGNRYAGEKNVQTKYRDLEAIPHVDVLISWLAGFQVDLEGLVKAGRLGSEKDIKGGSYVYTRRNMERFLDVIRSAKDVLIDKDELFRSGRIVPNHSFHDLVMEGIKQEYLNGMYKEDRDVVSQMIATSGISEHLGPSTNNPQMPEWVRRAQTKGMHVTYQNGEWVINQATLDGIQITDIMGDESDDYTTSQEDDRIIATRKVRSIAELFAQRAAAQQDPGPIPVYQSGEKI